MRWKPALNAFAITFADRIPGRRDLLMNTAGNTVSETDPARSNSLSVGGSLIGSH